MYRVETLPLGRRGPHANCRRLAKAMVTFRAKRGVFSVLHWFSVFLTATLHCYITMLVSIMDRNRRVVVVRCCAIPFSISVYTKHSNNNNNNRSRVVTVGTADFCGGSARLISRLGFRLFSPAIRRFEARHRRRGRRTQVVLDKCASIIVGSNTGGWGRGGERLSQPVGTPSPMSLRERETDEKNPSSHWGGEILFLPLTRLPLNRWFMQKKRVEPSDSSRTATLLSGTVAGKNYSPRKMSTNGGGGDIKCELSGFLPPARVKISANVQCNNNNNDGNNNGNKRGRKKEKKGGKKHTVTERSRFLCGFYIRIIYIIDTPA